jgi:tight adherence protein C
MGGQNFFIAVHKPQILAAVVAFFLCVVIFKAIQAYSDAVKLDTKERFIARRIIDPLVERYVPKNDIVVHRLRMQLQQAGLRDEGASRRYTRWRIFSGTGASAVLLFLLVTKATPMVLLFNFFVFGLVGWFGPDIYVQRLARERQEHIADALPSLMDLMVLCLDVGLSVEASFERVTFEMRSLHPLMAEEASMMVSEMGAGLTFPQSLTRMAERVGVEDLISLARLIAQASALGASVATALREYSEASMNKRMMSLDERAGKIGSLMVLPITLCMLPATMIALLGPAVVSLIKTFSQV